MMKHKKQHYIPQSYLKAWCDPECPENLTPYVWLYSVRDRTWQRKAPQRVFYETDMYTIHDSEGGRDLRIETSLSKLEHAYSEILRTKLQFGKSVSCTESLFLSAFVIAMYIRTRQQRDHWVGQYQQVVSLSDRFADIISDTDPGDRQSMFTSVDESEATEGRLIPVDRFRDLVRNPLPAHLGAVPALAIALHRTYIFVILVAPESGRFITSDAPCVWHDPVANKSPGPLGSGGLSSPTMEISLPVSPRLMLFFAPKRRMVNRESGVYLRLPDHTAIDELNKRTALWADQYIVSQTQETDGVWSEFLSVATDCAETHSEDASSLAHGH
jgi:hypothetical protein